MVLLQIRAQVTESMFPCGTRPGKEAGQAINESEPISKRWPVFDHFVVCHRVHLYDIQDIVYGFGPSGVEVNSSVACWIRLTDRMFPYWSLCSEYWAFGTCVVMPEPHHLS